MWYIFWLLRAGLHLSGDPLQVSATPLPRQRLERTTRPNLPCPGLAVLQHSARRPLLYQQVVHIGMSELVEALSLYLCLYLSLSVWLTATVALAPPMILPGVRCRTPLRATRARNLARTHYPGSGPLRSTPPPPALSSSDSLLSLAMGVFNMVTRKTPASHTTTSTSFGCASYDTPEPVCQTSFLFRMRTSLTRPSSVHTMFAVTSKPSFTRLRSCINSAAAPDTTHVFARVVEHN